MAYLILCRKCNYLFWEDSKELVDDLILYHNMTSHDFSLNDDDFIITRITKKHKTFLDKNAHNPALWNAFNKCKKL